MTALLNESFAAMDALIAVDPDSFSDQELHEMVVDTQRLVSRAAAVRARLMSVWDARRLWADDGSKAPWGRIARECSLHKITAKAEVRRARKLRSMPGTATALAEGKLSVDQADLLGLANQPAIAQLFAEEEQLLLNDVQSCRVTEAQRRVASWIEEAFERIGQDRGDRGHDRRCLYTARTFQGAIDVKGTLEPTAGTEFVNELERLEEQMFEADWAAARAEHGRNALPKHLPRTATQRRHDALIVMARRSRAMVPGSQHPRPLITVLAGYGAFSRICELADGTVVSPGQVVPLLAEADIERIVFDGPSRVIDVGVRRRFFTGALRRAIEVRDRYCQDPSGCDVPAARCHIDHKIPYSEGGLTTQENGRCACPVHNRQRVGQPDERPPPEDE
jgi:hypothetical protein